MRMKTRKLLMVVMLLITCVPVLSAGADCEVAPKSKQQAVPIVVNVRDGAITLKPSADVAVHLKQKVEMARWISSDGPFEIRFEDESVPAPACEQVRENQWQCDSPAFCYNPDGPNEYKYSVVAGDVVLDPTVIIDK
jgi:hypothetical protein